MLRSRRCCRRANVAVDRNHHQSSHSGLPYPPCPFFKSYRRLIPNLYDFCHSTLQDRSTKSDFVKWDRKTRLSLHADLLHRKLKLKHIQEDTFECTGLQIIPSLCSDYDSYWYGKMPEFLRVSSGGSTCVIECPGSHRILSQNPAPSTRSIRGRKFDYPDIV